MGWTVFTNADRTTLNQILTKVEALMSEQTQVNTEVAALVADNAALDAALKTIATEIAALQAANPALDLTGLTAAVAATGVEVTAAQSDAVAGAPPAP